MLMFEIGEHGNMDGKSYILSDKFYLGYFFFDELVFIVVRVISISLLSTFFTGFWNLTVLSVSWHYIILFASYCGLHLFFLSCFLLPKSSAGIAKNLRCATSFVVPLKNSILVRKD